MKALSSTVLVFGLVLALVCADDDAFATLSSPFTAGSTSTKLTPTPSSAGSTSTKLTPTPSSSMIPATHSASHASSTPVSPSSTSAQSSLHSVSPTPAPTSTPAPANELVLNDMGTICFIMDSSISVEVKDENHTLWNGSLNLTGAKAKSFCNVSELTANISIPNGQLFTLMMNFTGDKKKETWSLSSVGFSANETALNATVKNGMDPLHLNSSSLDSYSYSQGVGFQRFYRCKSSFKLYFTNTNKTLNPENLTANVNFTDLSVQAFKFKDSNKTFINGVTCKLESNQGSKIVPIAVGAALAALVIIVLIAYLIGRIRSRRQSYEALS